MTRLIILVWAVIVPTAVAAQTPLGAVYDPNPTVSNGELSEVELLGLVGDMSRLEGGLARVVSCQDEDDGCTSVQHALADDGGDFFYTPNEAAAVDPFAEVNAYYHIVKAATYFVDRHDVVWTCPCGTNDLSVILNYGSTQNEASALAVYVSHRCDSFRCGAILLGKGVDAEQRTRNFAYDGDVLYHEYAHGIIDERNGNQGVLVDAQGASYEPGAVREGGADYFAASISGDPLIAEYLEGIGFMPDEGALRRIDQPLRCPQDLTGQMHKDGRILGAALWEIRELLAPDVADAMILATLLSVGAEPTFSTVAERLLAEATQLMTDATISAVQWQSVSDILMNAGLTDCERILTLSEVEHIAYSGEPLVTLQSGGIAPLHFKLSVPEHVVDIEFNVSTLVGTEGHTVFVRNDAPVEIDSEQQVTADVSFESAGQVTHVRDTANYSLPRGGVLYLAVASDNLGQGSNWFAISGRAVPAAVVGGAGCQILGHPSGDSCQFPCAIVLILGLAWLRVRALYTVRD